MSKFTPKDSQLPPSNELIEIGILNEDDLTEAKAHWKENAPAEFRNLIEAEIRDD